MINPYLPSIEYQCIVSEKYMSLLAANTLETDKPESMSFSFTWKNYSKSNFSRSFYTSSSFPGKHRTRLSRKKNQSYEGPREASPGPRGSCVQLTPQLS